MTNTMKDLRREVATRLQDTLDGREIDTMEKGQLEIEHMLGIVTIGAISTPKCESGTLLDPDHEFWQSYEHNINTRNAVEEKIITAMESLQDDGMFRVSSPYGDDAGILYVEVDTIDETDDKLTTECAECGEKIHTELNLQMYYGTYRIVFDLDCTDCGFQKIVGHQLNPQ